MPYIDEDRRLEIEEGDEPLNVGELTYCLQQQLLEYLQQKPLNYSRLAECLGALEGVKLDLIERVVKPYEAWKCRTNGDVWHADLLGVPCTDTPSNAGPVIRQAFDPKLIDLPRRA